MTTSFLPKFQGSKGILTSQSSILCLPRTSLHCPRVEEATPASGYVTSSLSMGPKTWVIILRIFLSHQRITHNYVIKWKCLKQKRTLEAITGEGWQAAGSICGVSIFPGGKGWLLRRRVGVGRLRKDGRRQQAQSRAGWLTWASLCYGQSVLPLHWRLPS